jgi:hypothetical protein
MLLAETSRDYKSLAGHVWLADVGALNEEERKQVVLKFSLKSSNRRGSYNTSLLPMPQGSYKYNLVCGIRDSVRMRNEKRKKEKGKRKKSVTNIVTCTPKRYAPISNNC